MSFYYLFQKLKNLNSFQSYESLKLSIKNALLHFLKLYCISVHFLLILNFHNYGRNQHFLILKKGNKSISFFQFYFMFDSPSILREYKHLRVRKPVSIVYVSLRLYVCISTLSLPSFTGVYVSVSLPSL